MSLGVDITHRLGDFTLAVQFDAPAGITALFGRSGAGKTTVVNAVAGLQRPDNGRITVDGTVLFDSAAGIDLPTHRRQLGYVFQDGRLFPHLSVRQNLTYGMRFARAPASGPDLDEVGALLGIARPVRAAARCALGRRKAACRDRSRAAVPPTHAADG